MPQGHRSSIYHVIHATKTQTKNVQVPVAVYHQKRQSPKSHPSVTLLKSHQRAAKRGACPKASSSWRRRQRPAGIARAPSYPSSSCSSCSSCPCGRRRGRCRRGRGGDGALDEGGGGRRGRGGAGGKHGADGVFDKHPVIVVVILVHVVVGGRLWGDGADEPEPAPAHPPVGDVLKNIIEEVEAAVDRVGGGRRLGGGRAEAGEKPTTGILSQPQNFHRQGRHCF